MADQKSPSHELSASNGSTDPEISFDQLNLKGSDDIKSNSKDAHDSTSLNKLPEQNDAQESPLSDDASLYVGDLDLNITDGQLLEAFAKFGPINSVEIARNNYSKRSLGYAFVHFLAEESAQKALANTTSITVNGRPCRIQPFMRDRTRGKDVQQCNIFIKNLDPAIDNEALYEIFSAFGNIVSCKVAVDDFGVSKGFAYVLFETKEAAETAVEKINGVLMNDRRVFVGFHVSRRERLSKIEEMKTNYTNLYIKSIDSSVTDQEFEKLFSKYGNIVSCSLPMDPVTNTSRGFGFVNFDSHESAANAVKELDGYEFKGKRLYVSRAQKKYEREEELRQQNELARLERFPKFQDVNLYIKCLDDSVGDAELKELFSPYGSIVSAKIMTDDEGRSRGFGFVCYSSPEEAQKAIQHMNDYEYKDRRLYVAIAQKKDHQNTSPMAGSNNSPSMSRGSFSSRGGYARDQFQAGIYPPNTGPAAAYAAFAAYAAAVAAAASNPNFTAIPPELAANPLSYLPLQYGGIPFAQNQRYPSRPEDDDREDESESSSSPSSPVENGNVPFDKSSNGRASSPQQLFSPYMNPAYYYQPGASYFGAQGGLPPSWIGPPQAYLSASHSLRMNGQGYRGSRQSTKKNGASGNKKTNGYRNSNGNGRYQNKAPIESSSLLAAVASAANPEAEKQVIGEAIYSKVVNHAIINKDTSAASKVTGMLLGQDKADLLRWIDDEPTLDNMIREAYLAYMEYLKTNDKDEKRDE